MNYPIRLLSLLFLLILINSACDHNPDRQYHYEILKGVLDTHEEKNIFFDSTVTKLDFQVPIDIRYLDNLFYGKKFNTDVDAIVTNSDISYWNKGLNRFKPRKLIPENFNDHPFYSTEQQKVCNTQDKITDFDYFLKISEPFMNKYSNKALIYVEGFVGPNSAKANTYLMILEKQQNKTWKVVYKGALRVTSI